MKKKMKMYIVTAILGAAAVFGTPTLSVDTQAANVTDTEVVTTEIQQSGIEADLTISNARELNEFAQKVNNGNTYKDKVIKLTNDIVFDGVTVNNFTPIGGYYGFAGVFDGCGYTISGIDVTDKYYASIFGRVSGEIKNVTIKNCSFIGTRYAAGVVAELESGTVNNCHVIDCTVNQQEYSKGGMGYAGGIAAYVYVNSTVKNCSNNSTVLNEEYYTGGIVGKNSDSSIVNSCNLASVTGSDVPGGICGSNTGTIQNCFNVGKVIGTENAGGIAGSSSGIVANCYTSESACATNFGSMKGTEKNCKAYTDAYMRSAQFLNQLNANRGDNTDWFRWELRSDSVYPLPVKMVNIAKCNVALAKGTCVYNGKQQTLAFTVIDGSYTLVKDVDYTVSYKNNVNAGKATAVISGTGMYTGDTTVSFTIAKATPSISYRKSVTKTYGAKSFSLNAKLISGVGKLTYKSSDKKVANVNSAGKISIKGVGIANITIICPASSNYNAGTVTTSITVKPKKQTASVVVRGSKMKITWKKDSKASGYEVQYANNKSFKKNCKTVPIKKKNKTSYTAEKLKKKTTYYVRVRTYKTVKVNGQTTKVNGAWSKAQKVSR